MRIILIFFATLLFANEKLLIAKFKDLKPYYYNHQIVKLHLDIISAKDGKIELFDDYNRSYEVNKNNSNYYANIKFQLKDKFPKFIIKLIDHNQTSDILFLDINSKIKKLYPPKGFCGILADGIKITDMILGNYDENYNILYLTIISKNGNTKDFHLGLLNEKLYFLDSNDSYSSYSYSAIVPFDKRYFKFNYFNLLSEKYKTISFNIKLKNDTISTQTDIKPMSKNNLYIINITLLGILFFSLVLFIYKRKIIYVIFIIIIVSILVVLNIPKKDIILKEGTKIHVLPFKQSTVFLVLGIDTKVKVLQEKNGYKKIEFNKYIGWVKDDE